MPSLAHCGRNFPILSQNYENNLPTNCRSKIDLGKKQIILVWSKHFGLFQKILLTTELQFGCGTKVYVPKPALQIALVTIWPGGPNTYITQVQWFMYQNRSQRYRTVFCINRTANVFYDFIRISIISQCDLLSTRLLPAGTCLLETATAARAALLLYASRSTL